MKKEFKHDYRAAMDIHQSLQRLPALGLSSGIDESIQQCKCWQRRVELAMVRNWTAAAKDASDQWRGALEVLRLRTSHCIEELNRKSRTVIEPTVSSIYRDIEALRGEFECVSIDRAHRLLTVQTSSIELEGIYLGHFEIQLNWKRVNDSTSYNVIALDPNSPATDDSVTHPHVQGESLCEGEGFDAIRRALDEGRLYDFFCIVDHILRNYNEGSAYVSLDNWDGVRCSSCGDCVSADDAGYCNKCETRICSDCSISCSCCSDSYCGDCVSSCESCGDDVCVYCTQSCDDCDKNFCNSCLFEGTCNDCIQHQNEDRENEDSETEQSCATVHAVCDGEVAIPA